MTADFEPSEPSVDAPPTAASSLTVIGVSHRTCSDTLRQQIYVADEELPAMLTHLTGAGAQEAMVLSTCDRVEIAAVMPEAASAEEVVARALAAPIDLPSEVLRPSLYRHDGAKAVRHLFRVGAALDSQVIGEPQILGQMKAAHRLAREQGATGPILERVLRAVYETAKKVRSTTRIGEGSVSLAAAAVSRVKDLHGRLDGRRALLVGAGELGVLIAEQLVGDGLRHLDVVDRFRRRGAGTLSWIGPGSGTAGGLGELGPALNEADIVITALGEGRRLIDAELVETVLRRRRRRPIFLLDLSLPGEIDPAVHRLDDAYVYDYDDLEHLTRETRTAREAEAGKAEAIVTQAVSRFAADGAGRDAGPEIARLRRRIEQIVDESLAAELAELGQHDRRTLTRRIAARIAHAPSTTLRALAATGRLDPETRALVGRLFDLDPTPTRSERED